MYNMQNFYLLLESVFMCFLCLVVFLFFKNLNINFVNMNIFGLFLYDVGISLWFYTLILGIFYVFISLN